MVNTFEVIPNDRRGSKVCLGDSVPPCLNVTSSYCWPVRKKRNVRQLCRQFGISSATAYKWLRRFQAKGIQGLQELSRRPNNSPARTAKEIEKAVISQRHKHPAWGGRKLRARLLALGHTQVPSPSTITSILDRHHLPTNEAALNHKPWIRFVHPQPNAL